MKLGKKLMLTPENVKATVTAVLAFIGIFPKGGKLVAPVTDAAAVAPWL